jgi:tripartite-type tricarboxylate transporter receptor subunit TctC
MLVLNSSVAANTVKEFIAIAKGKPAGYFNYASTGVGAPTPLGAEVLSGRAGSGCDRQPLIGMALEDRA